MGAISGWGGRVTVNSGGSSLGTGTSMPVTRWTVNDRADAVDCTTMEHAGFYDGVSGVNEFDVSFDCFYDTTVSPFAVTPVLTPGASNPSTSASSSTYCTLTVTLDRASAATRSWVFRRVLITDVQMDDEVRNVVRYSVQGKATAAVSFTLGSAPTFTGPGAAGATNPAPTGTPG